MKKGFAGYYQQFEPAWANKLVLDQDDIREGIKAFQRIYQPGKIWLDTNIILMKRDAVKLTDEAIAHALRESHN